MALIIKGIMGGKLPWTWVIIGASIAIVLHLAGVPALAFSVGIYLPLATTMPIFCGGLIRLFVDKIKKSSAADSDSSPAVLLSSGYIAGGTIAGTLLAFLTFVPAASSAIDLSKWLPTGYNDSHWPAVVAFAILAVILTLVGTGHFLHSPEPKAVEDGILGHEDRI